MAKLFEQRLATSGGDNSPVIPQSQVDLLPFPNEWIFHGYSQVLRTKKSRYLLS